MYNERIKYLRERKGLKQDEIAKILETSQQQYSRYENGTEMPYSLLIKLAIFYQVSTDYILGLTNQKERKEKK